MRQQARWLVGHDPAYLLTYPSNVLALSEEFQGRGLALPVRPRPATLARIVGRRRNMLVLPDGGRQWPVINTSQGMAFIDFGFLQPAMLSALPRVAKQDGKLPESIDGRLAVRMPPTGRCHMARVLIALAPRLEQPSNLYHSDATMLQTLASSN